MAINDDLQAHLQGGLTTLARAWAVTRGDGVTFGFTDHDRALSFDGITFSADSGLTAGALDQATGLSVDNTEALGILNHAAVTEADIEAGRYDGAEVVAWLVNWAAPDQRMVLFRGTIGEITRSGGAFRAELRGLSEALNRPMGRIYQKPCTAVLGDKTCKVDVGQPGYCLNIEVEDVENEQVFRWSSLAGFDPGWFQRGRLEVLSGAGKGLTGPIKGDRFEDGARVVDLWHPLRAAIQTGDTVKLMAGCDKRFETCRLKFLNHLNYQGFPDIPGEDWMMSYPRKDGQNSGGSLR
ncbi:DUF2163 domain-containing protein [Shimia biformata]|uniref:DUF2163 domain-containing protein n=1 Tax=Shimia biformata TaxID=1294299 RepID=UPI00194EC0EC|nr:DUF2163 domain-containing protein [Shimia biformata]